MNPHENHDTDKASEREGLKARMMTALDGHTRFSRDCHMSGEYLCGLVWPMVEAALAPQPNGTEASRGVGAEDREFGALNRIDDHAYNGIMQSPVSARREGWVDAYNSGRMDAYQRVRGLVREIRPDFDTMLSGESAATPTPPLSPGSTGPAGDDWSGLSAAEIVRRTRCEAGAYNDDLSGRNTWRQCCDIIMSRLAAITPSTPIAAPVRDDGKTDAIQKQCAHYGGLPARCLITERNWAPGVKPMRCKLCPDDLPAPAGDVPGEAQTQEGGR